MKTFPTVAALKDLSVAQEVLIPLLAFAVPFFVSGPQWLTGTLVNAFLYLAVMNISGRATALVVLFPSLAAVAHGVLFGPFTPFLAFFLPFIWLGNAVLVGIFLLVSPALSRPTAVIVSALGKFAILGFCALAYVELGLVPAAFLTAMSAIQLVTALCGGALALALLPFTSVRHE